MKLDILLRQMGRSLRSSLLQEHLRAAHLSLEVQGTLLRDSFMLNDAKYKDPRCLARCQGRVYSQCDEDAVIAEIFRRIGCQSKYFVEIGAAEGVENVTRLLLESGWSGIWIEADPRSVATIRQRYASAIASRQLTVIEAMVTRENIAGLLSNSGVPAQIDLLSIDIDMNTSHVWRALSDLNVRVACIEYNASYPPSVAFETAYAAEAVWDHSNHFGASLKTLELIGREQELALVGCDFAGVNAYFVRKELADARFLDPFTAEAAFEPARYALASIQRGHPARGRRK